ncbi:hypothetical protein [Vibrio campbellii]|uniref:hypothetical protein n=1 Tax=Vibrio campbellii TaxID=680 RepID=UPI001E45ABF1|nr:hypothetical protein [Vibrio campbellii]MCC8255106.1 hypothetical protein [Vibrio campbellii CAIM 333]
MKKIATIATLALITLFTTTVQAAKPEEMSNSALMECANASNTRTAVPEHRAMFRHYLMAERGYTFSQLSSAETEFNAKGMDETKMEQFYKAECKEVGEYLYKNGY